MLNPFKKIRGRESTPEIGYTEGHHLLNKSYLVVDLYRTYRDAILGLSDWIQVVPRKTYIAFWKRQRVICDMAIQMNNLKLWINVKKSTRLHDPKNLIKNVSNKGHVGSGDYELFLADTKDLEYVMDLIKQTL